MRVLVCGGRTYSDRETVYGSLNRLVVDRGPIEVVIQGGARGADEFASDWASVHGIPSITVRPDWARYSHAAGPRRNREMLSASAPDLVLAFPGGRGTASMMEIARRAGVEVVEVEDLLDG